MAPLKATYYTIRHLTRFRYSAPISESVMEVRMHPRSEGPQRCLQFELSLQPRAALFQYRDYLGNHVYHFDVPGRHTQLLLVAEATVELLPAPELPECLPENAWEDLDRQVKQGGDSFEMLLPSHYSHSTPELRTLAGELKAERRADPLTLMRELNQSVYNAFEYVPRSTKVDSPIDEALKNRQGVCQDFAHILIALAREVGIPARYVSGYLYHRGGGNDRSVDGATHAWMEVLLPELGWIGFDPTNNLMPGDRHIRTALGRDYADVPPTRGVFRGTAESELAVAVRVTPSDAPIVEVEEPSLTSDWNAPPDEEALTQQQQQQQQ